MLPRTNGYRALMRFFPLAYNFISAPGLIPPINDFRVLFDKVGLSDDDFVTTNYPPGTSGETKLFNDLKQSLI